MLFNFLKKKEDSKPVSFIGKRAEIYHDVTVFQTGTIFIDNVRLAVKTEDGSELCKGTLVEVVDEALPCVIVKKI